MKQLYKFNQNMRFMFISMGSRSSNFYVIKVFFLLLQNKKKCFEPFKMLNIHIRSDANRICQNHFCKEISISVRFELLPPENIFSMCVHEQRTKIFQFKCDIKVKVLDKIQHQSKRASHPCIKFLNRKKW